MNLILNEDFKYFAYIVKFIFNKLTFIILLFTFFVFIIFFKYFLILTSYFFILIIMSMPTNFLN